MKTGSINPEKASVVAQFLKESFPGLHVSDTEEFETDCQFYRLDDGKGKILHLVRVDRDFLDDHSNEEIVSLLQDWKLPSVIRQAGIRRVLVTNSGCVIK